MGKLERFLKKVKALEEEGLNATEFADTDTKKTSKSKGEQDMQQSPDKKSECACFECDALKCFKRT